MYKQFREDQAVQVQFELYISQLNLVRNPSTGYYHINLLNSEFLHAILLNPDSKS